MDGETFWLGLGLVATTWLIGLKIGVPYDESNQEEQAKTQRSLCIAYGVSFFLVAYGSLVTLEESWWSWIIAIISGYMGFGAFLEAKTKFPNAPKGYGEQERRNGQSDLGTGSRS